MEAMDYWRLCDQLTVVQAALLVVGVYCGPVMRHPAAPLQAANFSSAI